jgi:hypothetical protein
MCPQLWHADMCPVLTLHALQSLFFGAVEVRNHTATHTNEQSHALPRHRPLHLLTTARQPPPPAWCRLWLRLYGRQGGMPRRRTPITHGECGRRARASLGPAHKVRGASGQEVSCPDIQRTLHPRLALGERLCTAYGCGNRSAHGQQHAALRC